MKSPTKLIDYFWREDFFKSKKKTKEVREKLSEIGLNPDNVSDLLKKRSYLKYKKGFWIQRYPFIKDDNEIQVHYFEPGKYRTSRKNFVSILNELKGEIKICDPYFNKDSLEALEELKNANVKFITSNKKQNLKISPQELKDFQSEFKNIEIKGFPFDHLHDRYIITKEKLFILGHGFSIRKKESFIIELPEKISKDLIQSLNSIFDMRWKNSQNKILCG